MSHPVARTEHMMLHHPTYHEGQRTGMNVGMIDTAVVPICIFPSGRTVMLLTEFLCSSSIANQAGEREKLLHPFLIHANYNKYMRACSLSSTEKLAAKTCSEINTVESFFLLFVF